MFPHALFFLLIFLKRKQPYCELQLGKRGLYPNTNSPLTWKDSSDYVLNTKEQLEIITEMLSFADGETSVEDLKASKRHNKNTILYFYEKLKEQKLLY